MNGKRVTSYFIISQDSANQTETLVHLTPTRGRAMRVGRQGTLHFTASWLVWVTACWLLLFLVGVGAGLCGCGPEVAGELVVAATTVPAPHARLGTRRTGPCSSRPRGHFLSVVRLFETNGNNNYNHHAGVVAFSRRVTDSAPVG